MRTRKNGLLGVIVALVVIGYCSYVVNHIAEAANKNTVLTSTSRH